MDDGDARSRQMTVGLDLGDKYSHICRAQHRQRRTPRGGPLRPLRRLSVAASATRRGLRSPSRSEPTRRG